MRRLNKLVDRKGATLIELIVTIAILGIIMSALYGFFSYGLRTFTSGGKTSGVQHDVNLTAFNITNTIRNVYEISVTNKSGYKQLDLQSIFPNVDSIEYEITQEGGDYFLSFVISRNGHQVKSKVLLNNVKTAALSTGSDVWYLDELP